MRIAKILATTALVALLLAAAPLASAHKTAYTDDGRVKVTWGFLNEPAVTHTKTGLDLSLTDNETGAPLEGVEETLTASLRWGDQVHEFEDLRAQHGQKGRYTGVITLTQPGIYHLVLKGTINGTEVDMEIPTAHEVTAIDETYFPPAESLDARVAALEQQVAALQAELETQGGTPATVTPQDTGSNGVPAPGVALALLAVAAVVLARRRA